MKKIFSIFVFLLIVFIGLYAYFSFFITDVYISTVTPKHMEINSFELMKLEKKEIAFLAESLAQEHIFLANERQKVNGILKKLIIILFSISCMLSLVFLFVSFKSTNDARIKNKKE